MNQEDAVRDGTRIAVVTGAAGGIGAAITRRLIADGTRVVAVDRDDAPVRELAAGYPAGTVVPVRCDLADAGDRAEVIPTALRHFGRVDIVVNNAADHGPRAPFLEVEWDDWDRVLATNVTAPAVLSQHAARDMARRGTGVIINITAIQHRLPMPTYTPYGASKGAMTSLTKSLAVELADIGVRVNAVEPGAIHSDSFVPPRRPGSATVLGRNGTPAELAAAVAFLASDEATFITGTVLTVDGGRTISRSPDPLAEAVTTLRKESDEPASGDDH